MVRALGALAFAWAARALTVNENVEHNVAWQEDLPSILKRAKDRASKVSTAASLTVLGTRLPVEVLQLLQPQSSAGALTGLVQEGYTSNSHKKDKTKRVIGMLNEQLVETRDTLDNKILECSAYLHEKEIEINTVSEQLLGIGRDISFASAQMTKAKGARAEAKRLVDEKQATLKEERESCQNVRADLLTEEHIAKKNVQMITTISKEVHKECPKGSLLIQSCAAMPSGKMQFKTNNKAIEEGLALLPAAKLYEYQAALRSALMSGDAVAFTQSSKSSKSTGLLSPTNDVPSKKSMAERCPVGAKPSCPKMVDRVGGMEGSLIDELEQKSADLNEHDQECRDLTERISEELTGFNKDLSDAAMMLSEATERLSILRSQMGLKELEKQDLLKAADVKRKECAVEVERLESELCALTQLRQEAYHRLKKKIIVIQDCEVTNWEYGPCSVTCAGQDGLAGQQTLTRVIMQPRGDVKTDEGYFGTKCPSTEVVRSCSSMPCPIDCEMASWASWSRCSKGCGGGVKTRHRNIATMNYYGGMECQETDAVQSCNSDPCDQDCALGEWTVWGACSRQCLWRPHAPTGRRYRHRHVVQKALGEGRCAKRNSRERLDSEICNNNVCPRSGKCVAAQDLVLVLDGSGSVLSRLNPGINFNMIKNFAKGMISKSILKGEKEVSGKDAVDVGMRYGVVTYGTVPKAVAPLMAERADLLQRIADAKFPSGETATGEALITASRLLRFSSPDRKGTVLLVTDALPKSRVAALAGARKVKDAGAQLIVVAVRQTIQRTDELCMMASAPCADNLLLVDAWTSLDEQLPRFLAAACPHIQSFPE